MSSLKTLMFLAFITMSLTVIAVDAQPLFWDLLFSSSRRGRHYNTDSGYGNDYDNGYKSGRHRQPKKSQGSEYGNLCRLMHPTDYNFDGSFQPANCPP